jgi:hypothetical protein
LLGKGLGRGLGGLLLLWLESSRSGKEGGLLRLRFFTAGWALMLFGEGATARGCIGMAIWVMRRLIPRLGLMKYILLTRMNWWEVNVR